MRFSSRRISRVGVLIAIGLVLWIFEELIPHPVPFFRLGLGNIASVIALYFLGFPSAILVATGRVILGAFILGRLFSPSFILSFSGAVMSVFAMAFARRLHGAMSIWGVSAVGAYTHSATQVVMAYFILYTNSAVFSFIPLIGLFALFAGLLVAFFSAAVLRKVMV